MRKAKIAVMLLLGVMLIFGLACGSSDGPWQLSTIVEGQGSVLPSSGTYSDGEEITIAASPSSGWSFDHWGGSASGTQNPTHIVMYSDETVYAYFVTEVMPTPTPTVDSGSYLEITSTPSAYFVEIGTDENYTPGSGRIACITPCHVRLLPEDVVTGPPPDSHSFIYYRFPLADDVTLSASIGLGVKGQLEPGKTYYEHISFNTSP